MTPRKAEATPAMRKPMTSVGIAPKRAMKSEPGSAAIANRTIGRPERMPTSVPDRRRSAWIDKITGGTARMLSRRPTPASQSRPVATQNSRMALPAAASAVLVPCSSHCGSKNSRRAFEARERFVDFEPARLRLLALLALAFDHILRRARDEVGVAELGVDAGDVGFNARHLLLEARLLGGEVDHPLERQC